MQRVGPFQSFQVKPSSRFIPYSKPASGMQNENYSRNAARCKEADKYDTADKSRYILRYNWQINRSGAKEIVIGADPTVKFEPTITLRKPGYPGIKLSVEATAKFIEELTFHRYFNDEEIDTKKINLSEKEEVEFTSLYGKKALMIRSHAIPNATYCFAINQQTWKFYVQLLPIISSVRLQLSAYSEKLVKMVQEMTAMLREKFGDVKFDPVQAEELLGVMSMEDFGFKPECELESIMDYRRAFYEIKRFCLHEILNF
jgi:hypothetical protein